MNVPDAAAELHEGTKHTWARILAESQGRDWGNHPLPFKIYPDLQPLWLPRDLPAGVYHFEPAEFALRRLRDGDFRARLAGSAAEPAIARLPLCLVFTGIPWRTTWKYGQRGYRHLFWDAGAIVANLLAVAA